MQKATFGSMSIFCSCATCALNLLLQQSVLLLDLLTVLQSIQYGLPGSRLETGLTKLTKFSYANYKRNFFLLQSLLPLNFGPSSAIKRGLLWQQRDKLFSRWKERYFILTRDYLHCFRRASGTDRISEMGQFLFKVKLVDVDRIEWENKKTYSTVALILGRDGKIYLRAADGLEEWYELLEECIMTSKEKRISSRHSTDSAKGKNNNNVSTTLDEWLAARQKTRKFTIINFFFRTILYNFCIPQLRVASMLIALQNAKMLLDEENGRILKFVGKIL